MTIRPFITITFSKTIFVSLFSLSIKQFCQRSSCVMKLSYSKRNINKLIGKPPRNNATDQKDNITELSPH